MQAAIIAMQTASVKDEPDRGIFALEAKHALAIADALPAVGITPCLICGMDSPVAQIPMAVPRLCIRPHSLSGLFRLWQWQRKHEQLLMLAIGDDSLGVAQWLLRMGKKNTRRFMAAFFLLPPARQNHRIIECAQCCICGSGFIRSSLEEIPFKTRPELLEAAPGMDVLQYHKAQAWQVGKHFVFGMGASLRPRSGALLLVRAMAALWQREDLPSWEVRMFGGGDRFEEILEEAEKLGVNSRLSILGEQPLEEVCQYCHVWLAPGTAADELPSVLWAGFAAGLPVIAAKSELHDEHLLHKNAAAEINPDNPQQIAKLMRQMMREANLWQKLAENGNAMLPEIGLDGMARRVCGIIAEKSGVKKERSESPASDGKSPISSEQAQ